jgi:hypothetical protein
MWLPVDEASVPAKAQPVSQPAWPSRLGWAGRQKSGARRATADHPPTLKISRAGWPVVEAWLIPVRPKVAAVKTEIGAVPLLLSATVAAAVKCDHGRQGVSDGVVTGIGSRRAVMQVKRRMHMTPSWGCHAHQGGD